MVKRGQGEEGNEEDIIRVKKRGVSDKGEVNIVGEELMKGKGEDLTGKG